MKNKYSFSLGRIVLVAVLVAFFSFKSNANVAATIGSISAISDTVGASITITGTNFNATPSNNIVFFGAVQAIPFTGSTISLSVKVPKGATYGYVSVTDISQGTTTYFNQPFVVKFPCAGFIDTSAFAPKIAYTAGTSPKNVAVGDIDNDGQPDLVVTNYNNSNISVYKNTSSNGAISFAPKVDFTTGTYPYGVAIGDLNGDGWLDLVVANYGDSTVSLFKNTSSNGFISFATKIDSAVGVNPSLIDINDLNLDGKPDVVVTNGGSGTISILENTSTLSAISFNTQAASPTGPAGSTPIGIKIGDLNLDGKPDIVVSNSSLSLISTLKNQSTFSIAFAPYTSFTASGSDPVDVALGDLNADNMLDLVVACKNGNQITAYENTSTGGNIAFAPNVVNITAPSGAKPDNVRIADIDGDSKPDIAVGFEGIGEFMVIKNSSSGGTLSLYAAGQYPITGGKYSLALGDFNGDAKPDVAALDYDSSRVFIFPNKISNVQTPTGTVNSPLCAGQTLNLMADTVNGGYEWRGPLGYVSYIRNAILPNIADTAAGIYSLYAFQSGCKSNPRTFKVAVKQTPNVIASPTSQAICSGDTVITHLSSTHDSTTFTWSVNFNGVSGATAGADTVISQILSTTASFNGMAFYNVRPTRNGCIGDSIVVVDTVKRKPNAFITSTNQAVCSGGNVIDSIVSNIVGTTYSWTFSQSNTWGATNGTGATSFSQTLFDTTTVQGIASYIITPQFDGCSGNALFDTIHVNPKPVLTNTLLGTICSNTNTNFSLTANIASEFSWTMGANIGGVITGAAAGSGSTINQTLINTSNSIAGSYQYFVTPKDPISGCSGAPDTIIITVNPSPIITNLTSDTLCSNDTTNLHLTASVPSTFTWTASIGSGNITGSSSGADSTINQILVNTDTLAGMVNYSVQTKSISGNCLSTTNGVIHVTVNTLPMVEAGLNDTICKGDTLTLTATGASTYLWSNGSAGASIVVSPLTTTPFIVTGTSINSCKNSDTVIVFVNTIPPVSAGADDSVCVGDSVTLFASGAATYLWSNTSSADSIVVSPINNTTYFVTGTAINGCKNSDTVIVSVNNLPIVSAGADDTICAGDSVMLHAAGASTYIWSNSSTTDSIMVSPVTETPYIVTGTSSFGCKNSDTVIVSVNNLPSVSAGADATICAGDSVMLIATGASTYLWSNTSSADSIVVSPINNTTYSVTGTAINGCKNSDSVIVTVNNLPTVNAGADISICAGQDTMLTASGTATSYSWNNGVSDTTLFTPDTTRTYVLTGIDANNCVQKDSLLLTVHALPTVEAGINDTVCFGQGITLTGSGSTGLSYDWNNGVTNAVTFTIYSSNTFTVIGTDANNCKQSDSVVIMVNNLPTITIVADTAICSGQLVTLSASGSNATYTWNNGVINDTAFVPTNSDVYSVTATDSNNCVQHDSIHVTVNQSPTANAGVDTSICFSDSIGLIGSGGATYQWSGGGINVTNSIVSVGPATSTAYLLTVTDNLGCTDMDTVMVTVTPSKNIFGHVSYSGGSLTSGTVMLFKYLPFDTRFEKVDSSLIDNQGNYIFNSINDGQYIIAAIPSDSDSLLVPTYYSNDTAYLWNDTAVVVINHGCDLNDSLNELVMVEQLGTGGGQGIISGQVLQGPGFGRNEGQPIPGVDANLGKNPGGGLIKHTTTDSSGNYTFLNLPSGNYTVYIDIPGLGRDSSYIVTIDSLNYQYYNLDYKADSTTIYLNPYSSVGVSSIAFGNEVKLNVYPNPIKGTASIEYTVTSNKEVKVMLDVYNMMGSKLNTIINTNQQMGTYKVNFNSENNNLNSGVYFIRLSVDARVITKRIVITE